MDAETSFHSGSPLLANDCGWMLRFFLGPLWLRISWCQAPPPGGMSYKQNGWPIDHDEHPESYQYGTTYIASSISDGFAVLVQKQQAESDEEYARAPENDVAGSIRNLLCEVRVTDIALVYFTYCLVIVGWSTMRSGERTSRDLERAIIVGGPTANPGHDEGNMILIPQFANYGRSFALLKEIRIGVSDDEPVSSTPDYSRLEIHQHDLVVHPDAKNVRDPHASVTHSIGKPFYCFGYFKYLDIFRREHTSRFCGRMHPDLRFEVAGHPAWNEWD